MNEGESVKKKKSDIQLVQEVPPFRLIPIDS